MKKAQAAVIVLLILILIALGVIILMQVTGTITGGFVAIGSEKTHGSGRVISRTYDFSDFKEVEILGKGNLFLTQDDYSVRISAEDNILELLNPRVEGDKLVIGQRRLLFVNTKPINIYVKTPDIEKIQISGSGNIKSQNKIRGESLEIDIDGSGDIDMNVDVEKLTTGISGSGEAFYKGDADEHLINIAGSGSVDALGLNTDKTKVGISGSGDAEVYADEELDIRISGSGSVFYKGDAKVSQSVSGSGKVIEK